MIAFIFPLFDFIAKHRWAQVVTGVIAFVIILKIYNWVIGRRANRRLRARIEKERERQVAAAETYIEEVEHDYSTLADAALDAARDAEPLPSDELSDADFALTFGHDRSAKARG